MFSFLLVVAFSAPESSVRRLCHARGESCSVIITVVTPDNVQDCPGMYQWCDTEDGNCKFGCDEQEDCPDGEICVVANHMCQCTLCATNIPIC